MTDLLPAARIPTLADPRRDFSQEVASLASYAALTQKLNTAIGQLEVLSQPLRVNPLSGRGWHSLLVRKLLPQLSDDAYLIVAVVGGTNIGKSVVFNHIAGFRASSSSPLASGTKHPVCLIPTGFESQHELSALFPAFELHPWADSDEALTSHDEHCLFWRTNEDVPPNLVILDTPDIDSDAPVNWLRADAVRQAADVLVAVLTQQKYNDAAVKQFFRKAAAEDKVAVVVFNRVELPDDEAYWPLWMETFCGETGLKPEFVYLAPNDRKAAEAIQLKFEERQWPLTTAKIGLPETEGSAENKGAPANGTHASTESPGFYTVLPQPTQLRNVLSQLRFSEIKLRTLRGSLKQLVSETEGVPSYLHEVFSKSLQFKDAANIFANRGFIQQADWPVAPNSLLVDEMWKWWDGHREAWTSKVHGFYSGVGRWLGGGVQQVRERIWGKVTPPLEEYRRKEWEAIVRVLQQVYDQLRVATTLGNELLTSRLEQLLSDTTCESILERLHREHDAFDFQIVVQRLVDVELTAAEKDRKNLFELLRNADRAAAVVRPGLTLLLAIGGGIGAEDLLLNVGSQWVTHLAIDATAAAGTTVAGEVVVDKAGGALGQAKVWLLKLHEKFKAEREAWLMNKLREYLLGGLLTELHQGASIPQSAQFLEVKSLVQQFQERLGKQPKLNEAS